MKRVPRHPATSDGRIPVGIRLDPQDRSLFEHVLASNGQASPCWACPDMPCMSWAPDEITREVQIASPVALDHRVCPSDAIVRGLDGSPVIDGEACIGCGLCVARCPVGALRLDEMDARAVVVPPASASNPVSRLDFVESRAGSSAALVWPSQPGDVGLVGVQMRRALAPGTRLSDGTTFRRLVRNVFLLSGDAARIRNDGDNSAWAEIAVGREGAVGIVEVEYLGGDPDAFRRVLSDVARVAGGCGVEQHVVVPMVALIALPNLRTDYYRLISDAKRYLDIDVKTLPLAFFLLAPRLPTTSALSLLSGGNYVADESAPEVLSSLQTTFGGVPSGIPGVVPVK